MVLRFLRAKLHRPELPADVIARPRLTSGLWDSTAPVWLIVAPAGYGKTTLVRQATDEIDGVVAWVSLDGGDNDPVRFWSHVIAAVCGEHSALDEVLEVVAPETSDVVADELASFIEIQPSRVVLVLDDVDVIQADVILEPLGRLLQRPPSNLTTVLIGRSEPALPVARLRGQARLAELRGENLAFTVDETRALLGAAPDSDELTRVVDATDGWPTALRMLALSSGDVDMSSGLLARVRARKEVLGDVLAHEVVAGLDPELQRFLVATSVVDPLVPGLCDVIAETDRSLAILRDLARRQLFTNAIDPDRTQFRYHSVFRDFLQARAQELPLDQQRRIHQGAADWYLNAEEPTAAITHALAAGNDAQALGTIKQYYIMTARDGYLATVNDWLERYGLERCREEPELQMAAAWSALNAKQFEAAWQWISRLDRHTDHFTRIQTQALESHLYRHQGQVVEAMAAAEGAMALVEESEPVSFPGVAPAALAMAQLLSGQLDPAIAARALHLAKATEDTATEVTALSVLAVDAARDGRLDDAEGHAAAVLDLVDSPVLERFHQPSLAHLARSMVALEQGRPADADAAAEQAAQISADSAEPLIDAWVASHRSLVAHASGHSDVARAHLRAAEAALEGSDSEFLEDVLRRTANAIRFARPAGKVTIDDLTDRELAVLRLLPKGLTRRQLGEQLYVSENTIKSYLTMLRNKLGVTGTSAEIVARARELELLGDEPTSG